MAVENYGPILNGVMWTQVVIAVAFIAMRLYTRFFLIRSLGWDDLLMIVNLVRESIAPSFRTHLKKQSLTSLR